jgi:hypothetical protein
MNQAQIDRLLAGVPISVEERHRRRIDGYAATARRADERISALRIELERVQPRIDSWLRVAVGSVSDDPGLEPFGEGPA